MLRNSAVNRAPTTRSNKRMFRSSVSACRSHLDATNPHVFGPRLPGAFNTIALLLINKSSSIASRGFSIPPQRSLGHASLNGLIWPNRGERRCDLLLPLRGPDGVHSAVESLLASAASVAVPPKKQILALGAVLLAFGCPERISGVRKEKDNQVSV
jgi:hypothetical protein